MPNQETKAIVDPYGKPARRAESQDCPQCGADPRRRVKSGMGNAHPVCGRCGYEWHEEVWRGGDD